MSNRFFDESSGPLRGISMNVNRMRQLSDACTAGRPPIYIALLVAATISFCGCASGSMGSLAFTSADEIAKHGKLIESPDLEKLVKGSSVTRRHADGFIHTWTNRQDGTFVAHTTSSFSWGNGTWSLFENQYCVSIRWMTKDDGYIGTEEGCKGIYAMDGKTFYAPTPISVAPKGARFSEIRFD